MHRCVFDTEERGVKSMIIITASYKNKKITRTAYGDFQAVTIINTLAREGATDIGMREGDRVCQD